MTRTTRPKKILVVLAGAAMLLAPAIPALADADLSVTKSAATTVVAGTNLTYGITVANGLSGDAAASVELTDDLVPTGTTFVSLTAPADWACVAPAVGGTGTVSCTNATVAAGTSAAFTLVVNVPPGTPDGAVITNVANVTTTTPDDAANNTATATTTVGLVVADLCSAPDAIVGTNGPDTLTGTEGDDVICGGNGHDTIYGLGGNDVIVGGNGKDVLVGGEGNDTILGRNGKDDITGGPGMDALVGGNGKDRLDGQDDAGGDSLEGGRGKDTCLTDEGDTTTACP